MVDESTGKHSDLTWKKTASNKVSTGELVVALEEAQRIAENLARDPRYSTKAVEVVSEGKNYRIVATTEDTERFLRTTEIERGKRSGFSWGR